MKKYIIALAAVFCLNITPLKAADAVVAAGKLIKADYTLTVDNQVVESSEGAGPLSFVIGDQTIIPGLEKGLMGMTVGEEKIITVQPEDGYGPKDQNAMKSFPKTAMPKDLPLNIGAIIQAQTPQGESFPATIIEIKDDQVVLDFNHPMAGKVMQFKVKIISIDNPPTAAAAPASAVPAQK